MPTNEQGSRRVPPPAPAAIDLGLDASGRDRETRRELAKLTATFLNGLATAIVAIGGLTPVVAFLTSGLIPPGLSVVIAATVLMSFLLGSILHLAARAILRREYRR